MLRESGAAGSTVNPPALKQKLPQTYRHTAREVHPGNGEGMESRQLISGTHTTHCLPVRLPLYLAHMHGTCMPTEEPKPLSGRPKLVLHITAFSAVCTVGRKKDNLRHVSPQYCCCRAAVLLQQAARWRPWCTGQPASTPQHGCNLNHTSLPPARPATCPRHDKLITKQAPPRPPPPPPPPAAAAVPAVVSVWPMLLEVSAASLVSSPTCSVASCWASRAPSGPEP